MNVSRRQLLQWFGALGLAACAPPTMTATPKPFVFLTKDEVALWDALADTVWPPTNGAPGGAALGASRYLDSLLSAFESDAPLFFADAEGTEAVPLDPVMEHSFRLQLYGSSEVEYPNAAVLGAEVGLRAQVREGLAALSADFTTKSSSERLASWKTLPSSFRELVLDLVCQGLWSVPAYGGNADGQGWAAIHLEGRGQPQGYSLWDESLNEYRERADAPVSTADTGADPDPMTQDTRTLLDTVTRALGGRIAP